MIRIIVVADQADHRARLRAAIAAHDDLVVVGEAANGGHALDLVATLHPDIVLMQALMPVVNGIAATRRIRADYPAIQVILMTPFVNDDAVEGLRAGAIGCLRLDTDAQEIVRTLRAAHQGQASHPPLPPQAASEVMVQPQRFDDHTLSPPLVFTLESRMSSLDHSGRAHPDGDQPERYLPFSRVATIYRLGSALLREPSELAVFQLAVQSLVEQAHYANAWILTVDHAAQLLRGRAGHGVIMTDDIVPVTFPLADPRVHRAIPVALRGEPYTPSHMRLRWESRSLTEHGSAREWARRKLGKMSGSPSAFAQRLIPQPRNYPYQIHRHGCDDLLQVRPGDAKIATVAQIKASGRLRNTTFHAGT